MLITICEKCDKENCYVGCPGKRYLVVVNIIKGKAEAHIVSPPSEYNIFPKLKPEDIPFDIKLIEKSVDGKVWYFRSGNKKNKEMK